MKIFRKIFSIRELAKLSYYALKKNVGEEEAKKNFHIGVFLLLLPYYLMIYLTIVSLNTIINGPRVININFFTKAILGIILYAPFYFFIKKLIQKYGDFDRREENYFQNNSRYSFGLILGIHGSVFVIFSVLLGMIQNYFIHGYFKVFLR